MFCSNCGTKLNQDSTYCSKCGKKVKTEKKEVVVEEEVKQPIVQSQVQHYVAPNRSGAATASLVLGIIDIVFIVFACFLTFCFSAYVIDSHSSYYYYSSDSEVIENIVTVILINILPFIMAVTGLPLGIFSNTKNKDNRSAKTAGIILNSITLFLCIVQIVVVFLITFS